VRYVDLDVDPLELRALRAGWAMSKGHGHQAKRRKEDAYRMERQRRESEAKRRRVQEQRLREVAQEI
jgi:hypothetical protein